MAFSRLIKRSYKSNRSENPHVKLNIQLTHCNQVKEILNSVSGKDLLLAQKTFALRMIARIITPFPFEISHLNNPIYNQLVKDVTENINNLKPLDLCDIVFWLRNIRLFGLSPVDQSVINQIMSLIDNYCKSQILTIRQTVGLLYDTSYFGKCNIGCIEYLAEKIDDDNEFITFDDIRQIFLSVKHSPDSLKPGILDSAINRIYRKYDEAWKVKNMTSILCHYCETCTKSYIDPDKNFIDFCVEKIIEKSNEFGEIQIFEVLCASSAYNVFPETFIENIIRDIRKHISYSSKNYSHIYIINLLRYFLEYRKDDKYFIQLIANEISRRIFVSDLGDSMLSRFLSQIIPEEIDTEAIYKSLVSNNRIIEGFKKKSFVDLFILFSKHEDAKSVIKKYGISVNAI